MPVMDEFKEERERIKSASFKEKASYYIYYYKFHVLGSIAALVLVISLIVTIVTNKDTALYVTIINAYEYEEVSESYETEFLENVDIDLEKYDVVIDSSIYLDYDNQDSTFSTYLQKVVTLIGAQSLEVMVSDSLVYENMYLNEMFIDLSTVLTEEEMERYVDDFYYVDYAVIEEYAIESDNANYEYEAPTYDHRDYESMEDPVAVGIYIDSDNEFLNCYAYGDSDAIISIVASTQHVDNALLYLKYVIE